jgi:hypothetical protein
MARKARMRMRKDELEELLEQADPEVVEQVAPRAAKAEGPADKALELQKTAGNRAVGALLQRWAGPALWMAAQQPQWPKQSQLIVDGQVVPLESVNEAVGNTGSVGVGSAGKERSMGAGDLSVVIPHGDWVPKFHEAASAGKHYKTVEVVIVKNGKGIRFTLTDVLISTIDYDSGAGDEPRMALQLSFQKREVSMAPPPRR